MRTPCLYFSSGQNRTSGVLSVQVVNVMIYAATDHILSTLELIEEVMTAWSIEATETQNRRLRDARREHCALAGEHRIRRRGTTDFTIFGDDATIILTIDAR